MPRPPGPKFAKAWRILRDELDSPLMVGAYVFLAWAADESWPQEGEVPRDVTRAQAEAIAATGRIVITRWPRFRAPEVDEQRAAATEQASHAANARWGRARSSAASNAGSSADGVLSAQAEDAGSSAPDMPDIDVDVDVERTVEATRAPGHAAGPALAGGGPADEDEDQAATEYAAARLREQMAELARSKALNGRHPPSPPESPPDSLAEPPAPPEPEHEDEPDWQAIQERWARERGDT